MSRVVLSAMVSLDGIFDGPGEGAERIDWFRADQEWLDHSIASLDHGATLLFGRVTFEGMAAYWPHQADPVARRMNRLDKIGFSRKPRTTTWNNARWSSDPVGEVTALRQRADGDILILGSANLAATLTEHRLIDDYRLAVNPVVLGAGTPLFAPAQPRLELHRHDVRLFDSGIVEIRYHPAAH
jgi:dihydrofolate reductase